MLRFDIGVEESTFPQAIGLDLFFDFEKDGDRAVNEMDEAVAEIGRRVSEKLNSGFRSQENNDESKEDGEGLVLFSFRIVR